MPLASVATEPPSAAMARCCGTGPTIPALMAWCEANGVHFLFGLAKTDRLIAEIKAELEGAAAMKLSGKVAIVTGARGGIGRAAALSVAMRGAARSALSETLKNDKIAASDVAQPCQLDYLAVVRAYAQQDQGEQRCA
jgi:hypothetical protein